MENQGSKTQKGLTTGMKQVAVDIDQNRAASEIAALKAELEGQKKIVELLTTQRDIGRQIAKLPSEDKTTKIVRADHPPKRGGYIVKMTRAWSGERMGIRFQAGVGIIDEAHPRCDELAHWMEADYKYKVLSANEAEINDMRRVLAGAEPEDREETLPEKLMGMGSL